MVFSQDSVQRTNSQWLTTFYDGLNRPQITALYPSTSTRTTLQAMMDTASTASAPAITGYQPLTYTWYDDYSWSGAKSFDNSQPAKLQAGSHPYPDAVSPTGQTRGMVTGIQAAVLNTTPVQWLTTTTYYDDKNRVIQTFSDNITGATDEQTSQYDFSGRLLSTYLDHKNAKSATPETKVLTINSYDPMGRLLTITKQLNDDATTQKVIVSNSYNELGQLQKKNLGRTPANPLDTLHYDYNIRGWLSGINKGYVNNSASLTPAPGQFFGTELDYDYGFNQPQVNGNIAGAKWKSAGDGYGRAFGYNYDNANRIVKADFTQITPRRWRSLASCE